MSAPIYGRVLLKLSGEALMGDQPFGIDPAVATKIAKEIGEIQQLGVQTGVVIGGGNLFRGLAASAKGNGAKLNDVRLAYFGVGNTPMRAKKAEAALAGGSIDDAVKALATDLEPHDDVQATGATKKHLAGVLLRRVAKQLMEARL